MSNSSVAVITLSGELDIARSDEVLAALTIPAEKTPVLLDLADVTYADSTVISALFHFRENLGGQCANRRLDRKAAADPPARVRRPQRGLSGIRGALGRFDVFIKA